MVFTDNRFVIKEYRFGQTLSRARLAFTGAGLWIWCTLLGLDLSEYGVLRKEVLLVILVNSIFGFAVGFGAPSVTPLIVFVNVAMAFVGNVRAIVQVLATLIRPLLGPLADRHGPKPFYLLGGMTTVVGYMAYALTESWGLLAVGLLFANLDMYIRAFSSTVAVGKGSMAGTRGKAFSLDLGVTQFASTVSPLIGGYVADKFQLSFREVFTLVVGLMIVGLVLMVLKYPSHTKSEPTASSSLGSYVKQAFATDRRLRTFAYLSALDWSLWGLSFPFYHIFIYKQFGATTEQLGIVVAIGSASPALASFLLGPVLDRARPTRFLAISEFMALGAFPPILFGARIEMAYVSAVFWGLGYGLWMPAMNSYVLDTVGKDSFARASGNVSLLASLLSIPSPAIAGWLYDNVSPKAPFVITMIGALSTGVLILLLMSEPKSQNHTFAPSLATSRSHVDDPGVVARTYR